MKKKLFSTVLALLLLLTMAVSVSAATDEFVYDEAGLLTQREESALSEKLERISDTYDAQIIVATVSELDYSDVDYFPDHLYDSMDFGYGADRDGVLLVVCMDPREYRMLGCGYASQAIDEDVISDIGDAIVSDLSDGDYAEAFDEFADQCEYYLDGYRNGFPFATTRNLLICLLIGLAVGAITVIVLKGQLKTVRRQNRAHEYVRSGSMKLNVQRDIYLYRNVTRTKKESSSSSSGRSSGGSSRSRGGGSF